MKTILWRSKNSRFGDNDRLSAEVAILAQADLLVILTSVEGLLDEQKKLISKVTDIDAVVHLASKRDRDSFDGRNDYEASGGKNGFPIRNSQCDRKRVRGRGPCCCSGRQASRHPISGKQMTLNLSEALEQIGQRAQSASRILAQATTRTKNEALLAIARRIDEETDAILAANEARFEGRF